MSSNFAFLHPEWPDLHASAAQTEALIAADPRSACFYARRTLELAVQWLYTHDAALRVPYENHLNALLHEPTFRNAVGPTIFAKARFIKDQGNHAVHAATAISHTDALRTAKELFHVLFWLARTYARGPKPVDGLTFDPARIPHTVLAPAKTLAQVQALAEEVQARGTKLAELLADKDALNTELQQLRDEIAAAKAKNAAQPDTHDYSEAETRDAFIDLLLQEAGWALDGPQTREYEVRGMPSPTGLGYVDYVLWGDDGLPLAVVEAKRARRAASAGQQQAKLYADCLEAQFGRRPVSRAVHPHVRGDRIHNGLLLVDAIGSPPRAWGQDCLQATQGSYRRFTPTCVGTGVMRASWMANCAVHPHVRGDRTQRPGWAIHSDGSPPRAWGQGPAPAPRTARSPVHPHVRGDRPIHASGLPKSRGSPPRAWGQVIENAIGMVRTRFTPTCVGTGDKASRVCARQAVHPHVRGDRSIAGKIGSTTPGSPPRAWGQEGCVDGLDERRRFTPTCVGTGRRTRSSTTTESVHPHVRGDRVLAQYWRS